MLLTIKAWRFFFQFVLSLYFHFIMACLGLALACLGLAYLLLWFAFPCIGLACLCLAWGCVGFALACLCFPYPHFNCFKNLSRNSSLYQYKISIFWPWRTPPHFATFTTSLPWLCLPCLVFACHSFKECF